MRKLVIDRAAIKNNLTVIKDRAAGAAIYGVVTGDGQGVGAAALAQLLRDEGIGRFAVSEVSEAEALRQAGFVDEEILMLLDLGYAAEGVKPLPNHDSRKPLSETVAYL